MYLCITEIQQYIIDNLNLEACQKYDDLSFDKFNLNYIFDIMLFNNNYSDSLNKTYDTFKNYYTKLIKIKEFLDLSIKDYEIKTSSNNSSTTINKKNENSDYIKLHECPKTEPALVGTTRRLNVLKK